MKVQFRVLPRVQLNIKTGKALRDAMKKPVKASLEAGSLLADNVVHCRKADFSVPKLIKCAK